MCLSVDHVDDHGDSGTFEDLAGEHVRYLRSLRRGPRRDQHAHELDIEVRELQLLGWRGVLAARVRAALDSELTRSMSDLAGRAAAVLS